MKMRKITLLAGTTLLASLTLTACGGNTAKEAENIDLASYSTEITSEDYQTGHKKYINAFNVENGYDYTTYSYWSNKVTENDNDTVTASSVKGESIYDKANQILRSQEEDYAFNDEKGKNEVVTYKTSRLYQKNGDKTEFLNEISKTYSTSTASVSLYASATINVSNYVDTYTGSVDPDDTTKVVKYYADNNIYTMKLTINEESEHEASNVKFKEVKSIETIFQFYVSDTEVYGKLTSTEKTDLTYTEGDKTGTVKSELQTVKYAKLKIGAQTLEKVDTSSYTKRALY